MKIIFDYNRTIFNPEKQELYSGVLELINTLSQKHDLFLISKKEEGRQEMFDSLGINTFFKKIVFTENKSVELFKEITNNMSDTVVVGDRVRGEISIGNELNYTTVWVKQSKFSNEQPLNERQQAKHTINDIRELEEIIKQYE